MSLRTCSRAITKYLFPLFGKASPSEQEAEAPSGIACLREQRNAHTSAQHSWEPHALVWRDLPFQKEGWRYPVASHTCTRLPYGTIGNHQFYGSADEALSGSGQHITPSQWVT